MFDRNVISDKALTILTALVIFMFVFLLLVGINLRPGYNEKIGQIVKVGYEGMFVKTWEAQLIPGGMSNGSGSCGINPFNFTIESETMAKEAQKYMQNQTKVIIKYRMEGIYLHFRTGGNGRFLVSIEPTKK